MNVLLGIPCGGSVKAKTIVSVISALSNAPCQIGLQILEGSLGPENRTALAQEAVDGGYTHLWLVDADQTFAADTLKRLLAHDKELVGAAYNYRGLPVRTTVKMTGANGVVGIPDALPATLFKAYSIGSGCKLVKTDALKRIPKPWFGLEWDDSGKLTTSDDVWFCQQAKKAGIDTWCDPALDVKHIGDFQY